jgi:hypothetical protein
LIEAVRWWILGGMRDWYEAHGKGKFKLKNIGSKIVKSKFLLCVNNKGYEVSLELRKLYENTPDKEAERHRQVRIIDESGEDYLYPNIYFAPVRLLTETKTLATQNECI